MPPRARRHDDGTASAVAGHVAWLLLTMMGAWTEPLHALPAHAAPGAVFAALRGAAAREAAAESPADGAARRGSDVLWHAGAARVAAAVLPHLPRAGGGAGGGAPASPAARVLLLAALWQALRGCTANAAAACRAAALPHLVAALAHAAGRAAALRARGADGATGAGAPPAAGPPAAAWAAAAADAAEEVSLLEECVAAAAAFSCAPRALRGWLARAARAPGARAPLLRALHGALAHPYAKGPSDLFLLDGESSGLLGLAHPRWPFRAGFTLATWMCARARGRGSPAGGARTLR
jgi:hypothetical protein